MESWGTYWSGRTATHEVGTAVDHIASDQFDEVGVEVGDRMYVITYLNGRLHVVTSIVVADLATQERAEAILGRKDIWDARWHVIARPETVRPATLSATLTDSQTSALVFINKDGAHVGPARNRHGSIDPQTFRTTRRIDEATAAVFGKVLAEYP